MTGWITRVRSWWDEAESDLRRYTRTVVVAGIAALIAYIAVLWDFALNPLRTALGHADFSSFYDVQMRQLFHGRLTVPPGELGLEAFTVRGSEYMYFPPGPSLLRAPVLLVTDALDAKLTAISMLGAWVLTAVLVALIMWRVRHLLLGRAELGRGEALGFGILLFTVCSGSVLLFLGSLPFVYHEAYAWAIPMSLGAAFCLLGLFQRPSTRGAVAAGAFTMGAIMTRTTAGWACAAGLLLAAVWFLAGRGGGALPRRWVLTLVAAALIPLGAGVVLNWIKFRHPYLFPLQDQVWTSMSAQRRAALDANGGDLVSLHILPSTLVSYFRPDGIRFTGVFPFITLPAVPPQNYAGSFLDQSYRTGSVVAFMPLLLLLSLWGLVTSFRPRSEAAVRITRIPILAVALIPGAIMFYGYIAMRYTAEFIPVFVLAGSVGYVDLTRRLRRRPPRPRRLALTTMAVLALFGFAANLAVSVTSERTANPGVPLLRYLKVQTTLSDRMPGHPLDDLIRGSTRLPHGGPTDRIHVVDDCKALFLGSGDAEAPWIIVEAKELGWDIDLQTRPAEQAAEPFTIPLARADGVPGDGLLLEFPGDGRYRGTFATDEGERHGRWRDVPASGVLHLRLFVNLTDLRYVLLDTERPSRGIVDLLVAHQEPSGYRRSMVFRSIATRIPGPRADGTTIIEPAMPDPATCADMRARLQEPSR